MDCVALGALWTQQNETLTSPSLLLETYHGVAQGTFAYGVIKKAFQKKHSKSHSEFSRLDQAEVVEWHADDGHAEPGGAPEVLHYVQAEVV